MTQWAPWASSLLQLLSGDTAPVYSAHVDASFTAGVLTQWEKKKAQAGVSRPACMLGLLGSFTSQSAGTIPASSVF